ncbi:MAG: hypothetical protein ACE15C_19215 [Phycisphaerae bacterium]
MGAIATAILDDMAAALRASGKFALVSVGENTSETAVPRAAVIFEGQEDLRPDGLAGARWLRVRARIAIRTRSQESAAGAARAADLCDSAVSTLLADPTRGGRCHDIAAGKATEVEKAGMSGGVERPEIEMGVIVRCHVEVPDERPLAQTVSLDGQNLFASGPCEVRAGAWQRSTQRRAFPGVSGEIAIDLGLRARPIHQTGRLEAPSAEELAEAIAAIEAFTDGRPHTLVDSHGLAYAWVLLEQFELTTPIRRGRAFWCEYACRYVQLP